MFPSHSSLWWSLTSLALSETFSIYPFTCVHSHAFGKVNTVLLNFLHELDHKKRDSGHVWALWSEVSLHCQDAHWLGALVLGIRIFFANAVMILYSNFCKSTIIIQFLITNYKRKYFCGHRWNLTSAANNFYTCVSYLVLNRTITCMLQLVKYYYKTPFAANLDQKLQSLLSDICSWEFTGVSRVHLVERATVVRAGRSNAPTCNLVLAWPRLQLVSTGVSHQQAPPACTRRLQTSFSSPIWGEPCWCWLALRAGALLRLGLSWGWGSVSRSWASHSSTARQRPRWEVGLTPFS